MRVRITLAVLLITLATGCAYRPSPSDGEWVEARLRWLRVMTDGSPQVASRLARRMYWFDSLLTGVTGLARPAGYDVAIVVFRSRDAYRYYVPGKLTSGIHFARAGGSVGIVDGSRDTRAIRTVLFHEYVHALVTAIDGPRVPPWFEEGLAEYMSHVVIDGDAIELGRSAPLRRARLQADTWMRLRLLLQIGPTDPGYRDATLYGDYHATAWALFHYLRLGMPGGAEVVSRYLDSERLGMPTVIAMQDAAGVPLETLERDLHEYFARAQLPVERLSSSAFEVRTPAVSVRGMSAQRQARLIDALEGIRRLQLPEAETPT